MPITYTIFRELKEAGLRPFRKIKPAKTNFIEETAKHVWRNCTV
jgi:hypothetical protein